MSGLIVRVTIWLKLRVEQLFLHIEKSQPEDGEVFWAYREETLSFLRKALVHPLKRWQP